MTKNKRRSIEVEGFGHGHVPIPAGSRIGPFLATGGVGGLDRQNGKIPETVQEQVAHMFANLRAIVEAGGGRTDQILKLTIWVTHRSAVEHINRIWVDMFPDPASRPARHVLVYDLPGGMQVQCEALAIITESAA